MNRKLSLIAAALAAASIALTVGYAQLQRDWRREGRGGTYQEDFGPPVDRNGVPEWKQEENFQHDVFTFVRVAYTSYSDNWRRPKWKTDYPDADLNFSYRLQELTSFEVDPHGKILRLTDKELFDYPFIYIIEPGQMTLEEAEVLALRKYLNNGGFLMVDDFWGEDEWDTFYRELKRVFPNREPQELPLEHEIFDSVYKLAKKPQIPSINHALSGNTTERWDAETPHYKAVFDDNDRIMAIICHNTDLGDGWEREGVDPTYFRDYSEKWAYPLGINIVTYAMTH